jgi:hypothetical protein
VARVADAVKARVAAEARAEADVVEEGRVPGKGKGRVRAREEPARLQPVSACVPFAAQPYRIGRECRARRFHARTAGYSWKGN